MQTTGNRNIPFFQRSTSRFVIGGLVVLLLFILAIYLVGLQLHRNMLDLRRAEMKRLVEVGYNTIEPLVKQAADGNLTAEEAVEEVRNAVRRMTFHDSLGPNYLFMSAYDGTMLVQPFEPQMEGTSQWDLQDIHGRYIIRDLVDQARKGAGFVEYYYPHPSVSGSMLKISYVRGIDELQCYIGTGMYIQDINRSIFDTLKYIIAVLITLAVIMSLLLWLFLRPYIRGYNLLHRKFVEIAETPDHTVPLLDISGVRNLEVLSLLRGFNYMVETLRTASEQVMQERSLLNQFLDNLPGFAFFKDTEGRYVIGNKLFCDYHGIACDELNGKTDQDLSTPEKADEYLREDREAMSGKFDSVETIESNNLNGRKITVNKRKVPVMDNSGDIIGIIGLAQDVTALEESREALARSLEQKETLLREIHHRIKNNLNIISSLLILQAQMTEDEKYRELLQESIDRINSMAVVHQMLKEAGSISEVNLAVYLKTVTENLFDSFFHSGRIELSLKIEPLVVLPEKAVVFGLIITELLTNALKYAFPDNRPGTVEVTLEQRDGLVLVFRDDGIGFLPDDGERDETAFTHGAGGLGRMIIESLVRQEGGELSVTQENGVVYTIILPETLIMKRL